MSTAVLNRSRVEDISRLVYREFGIHIAEDKLPMLQPKLDKLLLHENYKTLDDFYTQLITGDPACADILIRYITTCHTFFFREADHFEKLIAFMKDHPKPLYRIWSAACSTGEEPYSIAMTLLEAGIQNFHVIASDLNSKVLYHFNQGIYHENRLEQMPVAMRLRYFSPKGNGYYEIDKGLRNHISIKRLNLMNVIRFPEPVDYVFCRNVLIYFNEESRLRTIENITQNLDLGGIFFIGHSEVLLEQPDNLRKIGNSIYQRRI